MLNLLPAVLFGGPPHAGKSVLVHALRHALRERGIDHYLLRACPDGEGNWFQEGPDQKVSILRIPIKGQWPEEFVQRITQDLEHRCLPLLVDMGGRPNASSATLFQQCTHAVLLLREDEPEATKTWLDLIERYNQMLLARLISRQTGNSMITQRLPVLEGTICGLERHTLKDSYGETFQVLVDRIASVFSSYNLQDQKEAYLQHASTELVLDLDSDLRKYTTSTKWAPEMLTPYLASLPAKTPLSVYGVGPNWLIAALAAYTDQQTLYQFDPKLPFGWAQPARVRIGATREPSSDLHVEKREEQDLTVLSISFPQDRIDYFDPQIRTFPDLDPAKGLILNGRLPFWLLTALTRLYQARGVRWIAPYNAIEDAAIVAWSRVDFPGIAARILMPQTQQQK